MLRINSEHKKYWRNVRALLEIIIICIRFFLFFYLGRFIIIGLSKFNYYAWIFQSNKKSADPKARRSDWYNDRFGDQTEAMITHLHQVQQVRLYSRGTDPTSIENAINDMKWYHHDFGLLLLFRLWLFMLDRPHIAINLTSAYKSLSSSRNTKNHDTIILSIIVSIIE
jgi:hypothetical protein